MTGGDSDMDDCNWIVNDDEEKEENVLEIIVGSSLASKKKRKRKFNLVFDEADRQLAIDLHKSEIVKTIDVLSGEISLFRNEYLYAHALSIIPARFKEIKSATKYTDHIIALSRWFSNDFRSVKEKHFDLLIAEDIDNALKRKSGSKRCLTFVFAMIIKTLSLCQARIVFCIDATPPLPYYFKDIVNRRANMTDSDIGVLREFDCKVKSSVDQDISYTSLWLQLLLPAHENTQLIGIDLHSGKHWVSFCMCDKGIGYTADPVNEIRSPGCPVLCAVATSTDGSFTDLTDTYALPQSKKLRLSREGDIIWRNMLLLQYDAHSSTSIAKLNPRRDAQKSSYVLSTSSSSSSSSSSGSTKHYEALPTTVAGFKSSATYVLETQLGGSSLLRPDKKASCVALFKGIKVYLRENLATLKSTYGWRNQGRRIIVGEVAISVKEKPRGKKPVSVELFGTWQTEPIPRLEVVAGILPENAHGNIEIWNGNESMLPEGTSLVRSSGNIATRIAFDLDVQFKEALFGFEQRGGKTVPVFGGIVVLSGDADIINDAMENIAAAEIEANRERESFCRNEELRIEVRSIEARNRIRGRYRKVVGVASEHSEDASEVISVDDDEEYVYEDEACFENEEKEEEENDEKNEDIGLSRSSRFKEKKV